MGCGETSIFAVTGTANPFDNSMDLIPVCQGIGKALEHQGTHALGYNDTVCLVVKGPGFSFR